MLETAPMSMRRKTNISIVTLAMTLASTASARAFPSTELSVHSDLGGSVGACDLGATLLMPSQATPTGLIILVAGLGKYPIDTTLIRQLKAVLVTPGLSADQTSSVERLIASGVLFFYGIHAGTAARTDQFMGLYTEYWSDWIQLTAENAADAQAVKTPSLLLQGDQDLNVTQDDFQALKSAIETVNGSKAEVIPGVDHEFFSPGTLHVDPRLPAEILNWL
jgi:pimeloyl-ACP methyl ester carboxylesterase